MQNRSFLTCCFLATLFFAGCLDSKNPLSDPWTSTPDKSLVGVWKVQGDESTAYYHLGLVGGSSPSGAMRAIIADHSNDGKLRRPAELLFFPTTLGNNKYLNVAMIEETQLKKIPDNGWEGVENYLILKYKVEGDALQLWPINSEVKKQAIQDGKIQGVIEKKQILEQIRITDSTKNLAQFVEKNDSNLFVKMNWRLDRVK